ncbi:hypothetical protein, partial [uncultured Helicobacter sp.]|uniref:hypothetical protein n=1 Tax=uncultured Helicobacter sp. TaxID=175537 RepID=UPI0026045635
MAQDKARQSTSPESKAHNPQKPTRLSLSLACFFALSGMAAAATPTIPTNDPNALVDKLNQGQCPHNNCYNIAWKSGDREGVATGSMAGNWNFGDTNSYGDVSHYTYASIAAAYKDGGFSKNVMFARGARVDYLEYNLKNVSGNPSWVGLKNDSGDHNTDLSIGTFNIKGSAYFELKPTGKSTIDTLNNQGEKLNLKVGPNENNPPSNASLTIKTLNQLTNGDSQIFKNVSVEHFNLYA